MFFDTHAHYDDERFSGEENPVGRDALIESLFASDICGILNCATKTEGFPDTLALAEKYPFMYAALGIHPSDCFRYDDMDDALSTLESALRNPSVVALGEIGLDYHYDFSPRDIQRIYFTEQLSLASRLGLPAVIHDRDAHLDVFESVRAFKGTAVFHSCSESAETVRQLCRAGHYISFSGSVTFKNARVAAEAAAVVPDELLLIETDCPYLAPSPHRGELNHSGFVRYTAQRLAELRGVSLEHIERITADNAKKLFRLL